jgi:predicted metal-dependent peptidase
MPEQNFQILISASLLRLRMKSPFFATLALFARFLPSQTLTTAATDGKDIFFNPDYLVSLPSRQLDGVLLHEVLHAALLHVPRRGTREPQLWNIAADIVCNGMIARQGDFELPVGAIQDAQLDHLSVEEIYELLLKQPRDSLCLSMADLLETAGEGDCHNDTDSHNGNRSDCFSQTRKAALEAYWHNALQQAMVIGRTTSQGTLPAGLERELGLLTAPQLDWRAYLWRYLVQTPTDFSGYDRRFVGRGLYLEALTGESVQVYVAVDTSGSIDNQQLRLFLAEVQGILGAYPHLQCELYYADAAAYGPYELDLNSPLPQPQGGGGTSFIPFFEKVTERWDRITQGVCIYLTDGEGNFPEQPPELPVLWVVTPGGLPLSQFPFGEAVRLLSEC